MSKSELNQTDLDVIADEENRYVSVYDAVSKAVQTTARNLQEDERHSRDLTQQMVKTRNEEEKQFLQSDEYVAHRLVRMRLDQANALSDLTKQPYFARVVYNENDRDVEFKLGVASFPEQRIIDWRKAPISRLYYDYEEGEEYEDEIGGREREGTIKLKRAYRGKRDRLTGIELKDSSYSYSRGEWRKEKKELHKPFTMKDKEAVRELLKKNQDEVHWDELDDGYLSQILSLLSPEQFRLISSDLDKPVVIQGAAGTGKTTVAMHRLAWLLFEGNSEVRESQSLVVMFNQVLVEYVRNILPSMGIHGVPIASYFEWVQDILETSLGCQLSIRFWNVSAKVARWKSDFATVGKLQSFLKSYGDDQVVEALFAFYQNQKELTHKHAQYLKDQARGKYLDSYDLALLLRVLQKNGVHLRSKKFPVNLDHLLVDEAQDFTLLELKTLTESLNDLNQLTLAGDLGQKILENRDFGTWRELLDQLDLGHVDVLNLSIAYRSTYQIYELAEHVRDPNVSSEELKLHPKFGPEPQLTICHNFSESLTLVQKWIEEIININQKTIGAIVCKTSQEARKLYESLLKNGVRGIRYGDRQHFEFTPGITVTDVRQVKGLEFQALLLFNPSSKTYQAGNAHDRNLLYVAITRAIHKLDMICYERPSRMIPKFVSYFDITKREEEDEKQREKLPVKDVFELIAPDQYEKSTNQDLDVDVTNPDDELGIFDSYSEE